MKKSISFLFLLLSTIYSQKIIYNEPLTNTYSIVAMDEKTGEMGVAVQSHWFSVGTIVSWAEAGVGAIATQSLVNPSFGQEGLKLLKKGQSAREVLKLLIESDEGREFRQVAIIDNKGNVAAFTGTKCIEFAGHIEGKYFSVQANLMSSEKVWPSMAKAFKENASLPLAERMIKTLEAAENAGGDIRGKQSAALLVVAPESSGKKWIDRKIDLRVDDSLEPIKELKRLLKVHRAYEHMNKGDLAIEKGELQIALEEYSKAERMFPENLEMKFWHAVSLLNIKQFESAKKIFSEVFEKDNNWKILLPRLLKNGMLKITESDLNSIIK